MEDSTFYDLVKDYRQACVISLLTAAVDFTGRCTLNESVSEIQNLGPGGSALTN